MIDDGMMDAHLVCWLSRNGFKVLFFLTSLLMMMMYYNLKYKVERAGDIIHDMHDS